MNSLFGLNSASGDITECALSAILDDGWLRFDHPREAADMIASLSRSLRVGVPGDRSCGELDVCNGCVGVGIVMTVIWLMGCVSWSDL